MTQEVRQGDKVKYPAGKNARHAQEEGHLRRRGRGQKINTSENDPRYLVESDKSGKETAHKPDALSKV